VARQILNTKKVLRLLDYVSISSFRYFLRLWNQLCNFRIAFWQGVSFLVWPRHGLRSTLFLAGKRGLFVPSIERINA